ncbi:hypothetical protein ACROYT_G042791 [Oculina patagonica]
MVKSQVEIEDSSIETARQTFARGLLKKKLSQGLTRRINEVCGVVGVCVSGCGLVLCTSRSSEKNFKKRISYKNPRTKLQVPGV